MQSACAAPLISSSEIELVRPAVTGAKRGGGDVQFNVFVLILLFSCFSCAFSLIGFWWWKLLFTRQKYLKKLENRLTLEKVNRRFFFIFTY